MNFPLKLRALGLLCALFLAAASAAAPSLEPRWHVDFPKPISWYVRTSPGILLVRVGRSLTAIDGSDGRRLWELPDIGSGAAIDSDVELLSDRGKDLFEVPRMGVLLLDRVQLPGDSSRRLVALNLLTGQRLWDQPQTDKWENLIAVIPVEGSSHVVLISTRLQRKVALEEAAASAALSVAVHAPLMISAYPFRFEFRRLDALTGKTEWQSEYPHTLPPTTLTVATLSDHLFLSVANSLVGSLDLADGKVLWEDGSKSFGLPSLPVALPLERANGRLIYALKKVQAVDPATGKPDWEMTGLGKITGLCACGDVVAAIGDSNVAAVDAKTGAERWRRKTHGHTTNLLWDRQSDALLYVDAKGLHSVERTAGKPLFESSLHADSNPLLISLAGREVLVTISADQVSAYSLKNGKKLFDAGKPAAFFSSYSIPDFWPMPPGGQALNPWSISPLGAAGDTAAADGSFLTAQWRARMAEPPSALRGQTDAYETASESGFRKVWWIDPLTNEKVEIGIAGSQHDVARSLGMIFSVDGKTLWGSAVTSR